MTTRRPLIPEDYALLRLAQERVEAASRIPGVARPYTVSSLVSNERRYYYVAGRDRQTNPRLFEVYKVNQAGELRCCSGLLVPQGYSRTLPH
jgi:hypothetical protein